MAVHPPVDLENPPAVAQLTRTVEMALGRRAGTVIVWPVDSQTPVVVHPAWANVARDPGSLYKVPMAWHGLEGGRWSAARTHACEGPPVCWKAHRGVDLAKAFGQSCTGYFRAMERDVGTLWRTQRGWAYPAVTPLQVAGFFRTLARASGAEAEAVKEELGAGSFDGLAARAFGHLPVAGKTGTVAWGKGRTDGWFAGWQPARAPRWVVVVWARDARGADGAAPIAAKVLDFLNRGAP